MSWLTDSLSRIDKLIDTTSDGYTKAGMLKVKSIILEEYVKQAESQAPLFANYANPDEMK